jgi:NADPH2:quinone reductase
MAAAGFKVGDRVCALVAGGGYAELCVAPVGQCLPVPKGLSDIEAASLPETFFTVWSNVFDRGRLQARRDLHGPGRHQRHRRHRHPAGQGHGRQGARHRRQRRQVPGLLDLGADHAINYKTQDFAEEAKKLTDGKGVDVILDMVAGSYVDREVKCVAEDGRIVIIAVQGGTKSEFNAGLVLRRRITSPARRCVRAGGLQGRHRRRAEEERLAADRGRQDQAGDPQHLPGRTAAKAHALMESNQHVGKIVVKTDLVKRP